MALYCSTGATSLSPCSPCMLLTHGQHLIACVYQIISGLIIYAHFEILLTYITVLLPVLTIYISFIRLVITVKLILSTEKNNSLFTFSLWTTYHFQHLASTACSNTTNAGPKVLNTTSPPGLDSFLAGVLTPGNSCCVFTANS